MACDTKEIDMTWVWWHWWLVAVQRNVCGRQRRWCFLTHFQFHFGHFLSACSLLPTNMSLHLSSSTLYIHICTGLLFFGKHKSAPHTRMTHGKLTFKCEQKTGNQQQIAKDSLSLAVYIALFGSVFSTTCIHQTPHKQQQQQTNEEETVEWNEWMKPKPTGSKSWNKSCAIYFFFLFCFGFLAEASQVTPFLFHFLIHDFFFLRLPFIVRRCKSGCIYFRTENALQCKNVFGCVAAICNVAKWQRRIWAISFEIIPHSLQVWHLLMWTLTRKWQFRNMRIDIYWVMKNILC